MYTQKEKPKNKSLLRRANNTGLSNALKSNLNETETRQKISQNRQAKTTDIESEQIKSDLVEGDFKFTEPTSKDHIAGSGENIDSSLIDFATGDGSSDWFYSPEHKVSKRFLEHSALAAYRKAFDNGNKWADGNNGDHLIQNFKRQHTTYYKDFKVDVATILGAWSEGRGHHDHGTNAYGSFSIRGQTIFNKINNTKTMNIEIFNRWSIESLTRDPTTRKTTSLGKYINKYINIKPVDMYVQISLTEKLRQ